MVLPSQAPSPLMITRYPQFSNSNFISLPKTDHYILLLLLLLLLLLSPFPSHCAERSGNKRHHRQRRKMQEPAISPHLRISGVKTGDTWCTCNLRPGPKPINQNQSISDIYPCSASRLTSHLSTWRRLRAMKDSNRQAGRNGGPT